MAGRTGRVQATEGVEMAERPTRRVSESRLVLAEIVGEESLQGHRMQAGAILDLIDVLAGRIAHRHSGSVTVTLSFDRVDLTYPILHQDLVKLEGQLAVVGNSSLVVAIQGYRKDPVTREFMPIQNSFVTMVAVDENRRPNRNIPGLTPETPEEWALNEEVKRHRARGEEWQKRLEAIAAEGPFQAADVEDPINRNRRDYLAPEETMVTVRRQFYPRHQNMLGTIFGGDLLLWMDRVATYTARQFTRNRHMVTLAMDRILFKQPIHISDLVEMTARVVYVRTYTLEVEIEVRLHRLDGQVTPSHSGYFTVLNYDEAGCKRPITTGLTLRDDDQETLRRYRQACEGHRFWRDGGAVSSAG